MSCYHPLLGYPAGVSRETGKMQYHIVPASDPRVMDPYWKDQLIQIPCGKCIGCRLEYSRQWANRCMLELQYHDSAYFVTLTYNEEHVPRTGLHGEMSLRKRDFQLFMKRLRKKYSDDRIRFYAAGEYGTTTQRPHYHAILFGLHLDDLQVYKSKDSFKYFTSPGLQRVWSVVESSKDSITPLAQPLGYVVVAPVTWETCAYTARYTSKKANTQSPQFFESFGIEPPFTLMSRKPGIGRDFYDDHPDVYQHEFINVSTKNGGKKFRPPKYFDRLLEQDDPELFVQLKEQRKERAKETQQAKAAKSTMSFMQALEVAESNKLASVKKLKREL